MQKYIKITNLLMISVAGICYISHLLILGISRYDVGQLETTLVVAIVGSLQRGSETLYGPYDLTNHAVLMHAPLYYRLCTGLAWLITKLQVEPMTAALVAGRLVSLSSTTATIYFAYRICLLDGAPRRAGFLTACLLGAAPIPGILAVMVRPDMPAVCFQTLGILGVLKALIRGNAVFRDLCVAYVAFALAICTKQHGVGLPLVSSSLLFVYYMRTRVYLKEILVSHVICILILLIYFVIEEKLTHNAAVYCVFELPGGPFRSMNFASWGHVAVVFNLLMKKMIGYIFVGITCGFCWAVKADRKPLRLLTACLLLYLGVELLLLVPLCLFNKGSSDNYAVQCCVLSCILLGRTVNESLQDVSMRRRPRFLLTCSILLLLARDLQFIYLAQTNVAQEDSTLRALLADPSVASTIRSERYFSREHQLNRLYGRADLIHDEWLYGAFESVQAAQPRSLWLATALEDGPVRLVVMHDGADRIEGLTRSLPEMGYRCVGNYGRYIVWIRP